MPKEPEEPTAKSEAKEVKEAKSPVVFKYVAKAGEYLPGIPARDLTEDDVKALKGVFTERRVTPDEPDKVTDVTKKIIEASGLYEKGGS